VYGRGNRYAGGGFGASALPPMVKRLLIANVVIYLVQILSGGTGARLDEWLGVSVDGVLSGMIWQPFTYMWLHSVHDPLHLVFNMFGLWMFGTPLEQAWGSKRFLRFYLYCGTGAGVIILLWNSIALEPYVTTVGASGAVYGVLMGFSLSWPDRTILLIFPPIPIKAIWFIPVLFLMQITMSGGQAISHAGHLGGVLVALVLMREDFLRYANFRNMLGLRSRWHRWRMRNRLRAVRREDWERRRRGGGDDDRPTYH
jgi:membrane associated rhomboid family serine protease